MHDMSEIGVAENVLFAMRFGMLSWGVHKIVQLPAHLQIAAARVAAEYFVANASHDGKHAVYSNVPDCAFTREFAARMPKHIDVYYIVHHKAGAGVYFSDFLPNNTHIDTVEVAYNNDAFDETTNAALLSVLRNPHGRRVRLLRVSILTELVDDLFDFVASVAPWVESVRVFTRRSGHGFSSLHACEPDYEHQLAKTGVSCLTFNSGAPAFVGDHGQITHEHTLSTVPAWDLVARAVWSYETHAAYPPVFRASVHTLYAMARTRRADASAQRGLDALASVPDELLVEVVRALACVTYARLAATDS